MAFIAHENLADDFTITSPSGFTVALPLANLRDRRLAKVGRVASGNEIVVRTDLGAGPTALLPRVSLIAMLNMNITTAKMYDNTGAGQGGVLTEVKASNVSMGSSDVLNLSQQVFDRGFTHQAKNGLVVLPAPLQARYWQARFVWDVDAIGVAQAGRFWLSDVWRFIDSGSDVGVDQGWSISQKDPSVVRRSRGQQVYVDEKMRYRQLEFTISQQVRQGVFGYDTAPYANDWKSLQEVLIQAGQTGEVIICPKEDPNDDQLVNRTSVYGTMVGDARITHTAGELFSASLSVQEAR